MMREAILSTEQLTVGYRNTPVVNDVEIRVEAGEILCLI